MRKTLYEEYYKHNEIFWQNVMGGDDYKKTSDYICKHFAKHCRLYRVDDAEIGRWLKIFAIFAEEIFYIDNRRDFLRIVKNFQLRAERDRAISRPPEDQKAVFTSPRWIKAYVRAKQREDQPK